MSDHNKQDAYDLIRTELQLFLRQYKRRVQTEAEAEYDRLVLAAERSTGDTFDHLGAAREALESSKRLWFGIEPSPVPAIEGKAVR